MNRFKQYLCILTSLLGASLPAVAAPGADRVGLLEDANADFALRLRLTQNARKTLDIIMSQHSSDAEIGLPLLLALREAAERGVKIRMISGYFSSVFSHSTRSLRSVLDDNRLTTRPELILDGEWFHSPIPNPDATMWTGFDEKIMIADGERAVLGGRNVGADYLHWQDCSLYLDGPLVPEIQDRFFEPSWKLATSLYKLNAGPSSWNGAKNTADDANATIPAGLASGLPEADRVQASPQYTPEHIELLANGLIGRMMTHPHQHLPNPTPDPILEKFLELAKHSKRAYFYSLYPAGDRRMTEGLGEAVRNGSKVALITNSYESSKSLSSIPLPYEGGITTMLALAQAGVTVYQWVPTHELDFMHQKLAIVDDTVIFGSHNFNYSSTHGYDQLDLVIHDKSLADLLASRFEQQAATHTRVATAAFLSWQRKHQRIGVEISKLLLGLY